MKNLIRRVLEISRDYHHSHLPGTLSALQIMAPIFASIKPEDVFILSKGHAAVALYACLEQKGHKPNLSRTHPERDPDNGITCTTGSLGHGLPTGLGIALAKSLKGEAGTVHVLMGDGECLEGTTWESLNLAEQLGVFNLRVHIDGNGAGALGEVRCPMAPVRAARCFPQWVTLAETDKGHGVSCLKGTMDHKRVLTEQEYAQAMEELR